MLVREARRQGAEHIVVTHAANAPVLMTIPQMRDAMRSGWNGSSASSFSPVPAKRIGLPVTERSDSAAPPRASPSIFVRMIPVSGSRLANPSAVATAS